jgi:hypothetical protein
MHSAGAMKHTTRSPSLGLLLFAVTMAISQASYAQESEAPVSPEAKADRARMCVDGMRGQLREGFELLEDARTAGDLERISCIEQALDEMKGLVRLSESKLTGLDEGLAKKDSRRVDREYLKVAIACDKAEALRGRVQGCGGPDFVTEVDGKPTVTQVTDPDVPRLVVETGLGEVKLITERPPSATLVY